MKNSRGIAWENKSWEIQEEIESWLIDTFGKASKETWYIDQDYDLVNLIMDEKIYLMYVLKWK